MDNPLGETVTCHAGASYPERPVSFLWQGERLPVVEIITEWQTPQGKNFLVETESELVFELRYFQESNTWQINPAAVHI